MVSDTANNYKLPLFVVCWHYIVKYIAAVSIRFLYEVLRKKRIRLQLKDQLRWLAPIGICASLDIGLSNWALEYVTNYKLPLFVVCWHYIVKYIAAVSIRFLYEMACAYWHMCFARYWVIKLGS
ncbi:hypothetical protein TELCIR_06129 [Teladorsagia circumcincta]|uniref:Uncharacterized protein n=1 Tax=Teladorsagia circumcincta TaxID=45464 RepID=A0A2G9UP73_TELCI|nr:hypothetical protein TELCIR_06129 [Teladorsagia circumcincta]